MHFEDNQLYRIKEIADRWQVSLATVYRLVESGDLAALRFGKGKGALRVSGRAINGYLASAATAIRSEVA
jgi:excisionase family DNA binding protein